MRRAPSLYQPPGQEQKDDHDEHKLLLPGQINHVVGLAQAISGYFSATSPLRQAQFIVAETKRMVRREAWCVVRVA